MKRNGMYVLNFSAPALYGQELIYLRGKQFMGQLVALCFLPHAALLASEEIDHQGQGFQDVGATLILVNSDVRPLHRLWIDRRGQPSTMVVGDPCGRLQRFFGVKSSEVSPRCQTFVIDRDGTLRLRLVHDFVDRDLKILRSMIRPSNVEIADGYAGVPASVSVEAGDFVGVTKVGD